jgi:hypothetical protein
LSWSENVFPESLQGQAASGIQKRSDGQNKNRSIAKVEAMGEEMPGGGARCTLNPFQELPPESHMCTFRAGRTQQDLWDHIRQSVHDNKHAHQEVSSGPTKSEFHVLINLSCDFPARASLDTMVDFEQASLQPTRIRDFEGIFH